MKPLALSKHGGFDYVVGLIHRFEIVGGYTVANAAALVVRDFGV